MSRRPVRSTVLLLAVWAVLFAPGAVGDAASGWLIGDTDDLGAAVIAPTFDPAGLIVARPCQDDDPGEHQCDDLAGPPPTLVPVAAVASLSTPLETAGATESLARADPGSPRAPPSP